MKHEDAILGRRHFLYAAGAFGLTPILSRAAAATSTATPIWAAGSCTLTPTSTAGPFYFDLDLLRRDIREGRLGIPLELFFRVIRASDCQPIAGAVVDLWHTDALGRYSGVPSQGTAGQTFLRGIQITPVNGIVHFTSIFPGWYLGRATHLHLKVRPDQVSELTTQLYFPTHIARTIESVPPYSLRGPNPVSNDEDAFFTPETVMPGHELGLASLSAPFPGPRGVIAGITIVVA